MPSLSVNDKVLLHIGTAKAEYLASMKTDGRHPLPLADLIKQATNDRLHLASNCLKEAHDHLSQGRFRPSISRNYYAMYHSARAIVFAFHEGDDFQQHSVIPKHLPQDMPDFDKLAQDLKNARLLRNQADYDAYPISSQSWQTDATKLTVTASIFLNCCDNYAQSKGLI